MVLKKIYQAIEDTVFIEAEGLWMDPLLSEMGKENFEKLKNLPQEIINEVKSFVKRNSLVVIAYKIEDHKPLHCCCSRCLKAHLIKKCGELGMEEYKKVISKIFECKTGHDGYYLDNSELFRG